MAVTTLAGEKMGIQNIKCNRLLLLDRSHKLKALYKVNIYIVKQQNTVLIPILFVSE